MKLQFHIVSGAHGASHDVTKLVDNSSAAQPLAEAETSLEAPSFSKILAGLTFKDKEGLSPETDDLADNNATGENRAPLLTEHDKKPTESKTDEAEFGDTHAVDDADIADSDADIADLTDNADVAQWPAFSPRATSATRSNPHSLQPEQDNLREHTGPDQREAVDLFQGATHPQEHRRVVYNSRPPHQADLGIESRPLVGKPPQKERFQSEPVKADQSEPLQTAVMSPRPAVALKKHGQTKLTSAHPLRGNIMASTGGNQRDGGQPVLLPFSTGDRAGVVYVAENPGKQMHALDRQKDHVKETVMTRMATGLGHKQSDHVENVKRANPSSIARTLPNLPQKARPEISVSAEVNSWTKTRIHEGRSIQKGGVLDAGPAIPSKKLLLSQPSRNETFNVGTDTHSRADPGIGRDHTVSEKPLMKTTVKPFYVPVEQSESDDFAVQSARQNRAKVKGPVHLSTARVPAEPGRTPDKSETVEAHLNKTVSPITGYALSVSRPANMDYSLVPTRPKSNVSSGQREGKAAENPLKSNLVKVSSPPFGPPQSELNNPEARPRHVTRSQAQVLPPVKPVGSVEPTLLGKAGRDVTEPMVHLSRAKVKSPSSSKQAPPHMLPAGNHGDESGNTQPATPLSVGVEHAAGRQIVGNKAIQAPRIKTVLVKKYDGERSTGSAPKRNGTLFDSTAAGPRVIPKPETVDKTNAPAGLAQVGPNFVPVVNVVSQSPAETRDQSADNSVSVEPSRKPEPASRQNTTKSPGVPFVPLGQAEIDQLVPTRDTPQDRIGIDESPEIGGHLAPDRGHEPQPLKLQPTTSARAEQTIVRQITDAFAARSGASFEVQLAPEELGRIKFVFTQGEAGLQVTLTADRIETGDILRRHADLFGKELTEAGYENVEFSFGQQQKQRHDFEERIVRMDAEDDVPEDYQTHSPPTSNDSVDIRI